MRFLLALFLVLTLPSLALADGSDWDKANAYYRQKNYDSAAACYERVAAGRPDESVVFYNLGNAYYRLNRIGPAVLNYERALHRNPGMTEARDNLLLAQSRISNRIAGGEDIFFLRWWRSLTHPVHATAWCLAALVFFIAALALAFTARFRNRSTPVSARLTAATGCLALLCLVLAFAATRHRWSDKAVVLEEGAPIRWGTGNAAPALVPEGTVVQVQSARGTQRMVTLPDGRSGWMSDQDLGLVD